MALPKHPDSRVRNRDATEKAILASAKQVLAEEGFQSFGINAIARQAGCDKQLIYRYFGGLDGLAEAIGADLANELTDELKPYANQPPPQTYGALMKRLALGLLDLQRGNRLMQQINAWEAAAPSPLAAKMIAARSKRMGVWMFEMRGSLKPPEGVDAPALNAIIIAAIQQLVVSGAATGVFSGLPLDSEDDWARVRAALSALVEAVYGP
jgi:AcrR family transcriptional regulator